MVLTPQRLAKIYDVLERWFRNHDVIAGKTGRHMKFPYTISAKIAQFPFYYYCKNNPIWTYYPLGCMGGFYVFWKIHRVVNSEANVRAWAESQAKIAEKEAHH